MNAPAWIEGGAIAEYRVTYIETATGKKCLKRWPSVEEARAFIVGLRRGAPVEEIKLHLAVEGEKMTSLPLKAPATILDPVG